MRAGAALFAEHGIDGALTRDIVSRAGQSNDSAVTYHFGSRQGLLEAILRAGVERMEAARAADLARLDPSDLHAVVAAIVEPIAAELRTEEGRDFLRIVVQVAGLSGVRSRTLPALIQDTALAGELRLLENRCRELLPEPLALERIASFISFLTAVLADRAARPGPHLLDHPTFTANLIEMLTAGLAAPVPARTPKSPTAASQKP